MVLLLVTQMNPKTQDDKFGDAVGKVVWLGPNQGKLFYNKETENILETFSKSFK